MSPAIPPMLVAALALTGMAVGVRLAAQSVGIFDILAIRGIFGIVAVTALAAIGARGLAQLRPVSLGRHLARNGVQFAGQVAWTSSIVALPLATTFALEFASPIFAMTFAVILLGEHLTKARVASLVLAVAGIATIGGGGMVAGGILLALPVVAAACFGLSDVLTRSLTRRQGPLAIMFWLNVIQTPMALVLADPSSWPGIPTDAIGPLALVCACGLAGHLAITRALSVAEASSVAPLHFLRLPVATAGAILIFGEWPPATVLPGAALLALSVLVTLRSRPDPASMPGSR